MRKLVLVVLIACSTFFAFYQPALTWAALHTNSYLQSIMFTRNVSIIGNKLLLANKLSGVLDHKLNNFYWRFNPDTIVQPLNKISILEKAELRPCDFFSLTCYQLLVKERTPKMLARLNQEHWLLDNSGSYLLKLSNLNEPAAVDRVAARIGVPYVLGLDRESPSVSALQSRAQYLARCIDRLYKLDGLPVSRIKLMINGELALKFKDYPFIVNLSSSFENAHILELELERLQQILPQITAYKSAIDRIDLAFNKVAVLRFTDSAMAAKASLKTVGSVKKAN